MIQLSCLGAMNTVGASGLFVDTGAEKIVLDYGTKVKEVPPIFPIAVDCKPDAVLLSHAHLDHCLHPSTYIQTGSGDIVKIKDLYNSSIESVIAFDIDNSLSQEKVMCKKSAIKSPKILYKIRTKSKAITTTPEHRFFVLDGLNIVDKRAFELEKNNFIMTSKKIDFKGTPQNLPKIKLHGAYKINLPTKTTNSLCQFIGYLLGDGDAYKIRRKNRKSFSKQIRITDKDKKLLEFYKDLVKKQFNINGFIQRRKDAKSFRLRFGSSFLYDFIFSISDKILSRSIQREIPSVIHRNSNEQIASFLRGLFDAEGCVTGHKIALTSKNYDIIQVAQMLLLRFGIFSHIYKQNGGKNPKRPTYQLTVYNPESIERFFNFINFNSKSKAKRLKKLLTFVGGGIERIDIVPIQSEEIIKIVKILGIKKTDLKKVNFSYQHYLKGKHYPSRKKLLEIIGKLPKSKKLFKLKRLLNSDILWDRIVEIEKVESDCDSVYDLTVAGHHNFIANGIVVHNSGALPIFSAKGNGCLIYATSVTKPLVELLLEDSLKISREEGIKLPFDRKNVNETIKNFVAVKYRQPLKLHATTVTAYDAGHIPGSCMFHLKFREGRSMLYTGDFKTTDTRLLKKADENLPETDILVTESTYAQRDHLDRKMQERELIRTIESTLAVDGTTVISGFAVGRISEILLVLDKYQVDCPLFVDGMAKKALTIENKYRQFIREPDLLDKALEKADYVGSERARRRVLKRPSVVLTTSGMLNGGPVVWYIKKLFDRKNCSLVLTGFQVEDTPGRILMETGRFVLGDINLELQMRVKRFDFSSHIGRTELFAFIENLGPQKIFCVHGDHTEEFADELKQKGYDATAPVANNRIFRI